MPKQRPPKILLDYEIVRLQPGSLVEPWGRAPLSTVVQAYLTNITEPEAIRLIGQTITFGPFKVKFTGLK